MTTLLIIFAKEPAPGQVKTRLSPPLSPEAVARLYRSFLEDILEEMSRCPGMDLALAYTPPGAIGFFEALAPSGASLLPQTEGDLGERMARAFDWGFAAGYEVVLLRGSDTPDLPAAVPLAGMAALKSGRADLVLGPARDGGYYLIGLRAPQAKLFLKPVWSTGTVLAETLSTARDLGLTVHLLPTWQDIDTAGDLLAFLARPHPAPHPGWRSDRLARSLIAEQS